MYITITVKTNRYRFLWLKYIAGFDISHHCARCLKGHYSKIISYGSQLAGSVYEGNLDEHDTPYLYLCGVTNKHADNLHIAFTQQPGETITYEDANVSVVVTDAVQLPIHGVKEHTFPTPFATCRNFQFGYEYLSEVSHA